MKRDGWKSMYQRWKMNNPLAKDETRSRMVRGCVNKFAYPNFTMLMLSARRLERDMAFAGKLNAYHCPLCARNHIGNYRGRIRFAGCGDSAEQEQNKASTTSWGVAVTDPPLRNEQPVHNLSRER